ncbi:hypothetical protein FNV43_RR22079 [Rhamnella rubrinervis]|uniref:Uncharacterized protein n=1 Tax=Rhamnella rubrinervis TaxID=2594499 RepID=A0A8K0E1A5_9ROSA|nr:hypothetical protein FNV43_RR22079 [Rhamnella rubrinervis]
MNSRRGGRKPYTGANNEPGANSSDVQQLSHDVVGITLDSKQDDGQWEVIARNSKNRAGSCSSKSRVPQNTNPKVWGHTDVVQKPAGWAPPPGNAWQTQAAVSKRSVGSSGSIRPQSTRYTESRNVTPQPVIRPPLEHGWNWQSRAGSIEKDEIGTMAHAGEDIEADKDNEIDDDDNEDDILDDTDDELLSDEFDSDSNEKNHGTLLKENKWFKKFFVDMESLSIDEINDPASRWHCPACQGGPGGIDWYLGLQSLMMHAKTKGSKRVRLHRGFAEILEEELQMRGASVIPTGATYGKWNGLEDDEKDHEIVWPPMVVIMNTKLEQDEKGKWTGMGNKELLDYFRSYLDATVKARHSYGPQGHRGISVLIFEASGGGYLEAKRLHEHFVDQGTDRNAWDHRRILFHHGGNRQLYGFLARKEDLDIFNQHSQGKSKLKYEMRSYQESVVNQIKQMIKDYHQLSWFKDRHAKDEMIKKDLENINGILRVKQHKSDEEKKILRLRAKEQYEEIKEEMNKQEEFYREQIKAICESRDANEEKFEMLQQKEREKVEQSNAADHTSNAEEYRRRADEIAKFVKFQDKEMEEYEKERDILIKSHEAKMAAQWEKEVELQKEFDVKLTQLKEKYAPYHHHEDCKQPLIMKDQ